MRCSRSVSGALSFRPRRWPKLAHDMGQSWPRSGQVCSKLRKVRPKLVDIGQTWPIARASIGRSRAELGRRRANVGRNRAKIGSKSRPPNWADICRIRPTFADIGPNLREVGPNYARFDRLRPNLGQNRPGFAQVWAKPTSFRNEGLHGAHECSRSSRGPLPQHSCTFYRACFLVKLASRVTETCTETGGPGVRACFRVGGHVTSMCLALSPRSNVEVFGETHVSFWGRRRGGGTRRWKVGF